MPDSGIYHAIHRGHRAPHPVLALKGELFPACRGCGARVRYDLVEPVPHMTHDWDFAGPGLFLVKNGKQKTKRSA